MVEAIKVIVDRQDIVAIADSVRSKTGQTDELTLGQIASGIDGIGIGADTSDATATADEIFAGKTAYIADGKITGTFTIEDELTTQDDLISQIQTALQNKASVSEPVLQDKTVSPTTSSQTITPDSGYDGLSSVTVNAMPTTTQVTPSITVSSSGLITATTTQSAGYITAGTKSNTKQLTTQAAQTITPSTSSQTAVSSGVYTTGAVTVAAIPSNYEDVGTETTEYTSLNTELEEVINSLPNAGSGDSGGSGSVETCTVTVTTVNESNTLVVYTSVDDNKITVAKVATSGTLTVVCGTAISVRFKAVSQVYTGSGFADSNPSDWDFMDYAVLLAPREANAQAYLNCIDDD